MLPTKNQGSTSYSFRQDEFLASPSGPLPSLFKLCPLLILMQQVTQETCLILVTTKQGWAENSTASIYRWNLPVFPGMANKAEVANTGK